MIKSKQVFIQPAQKYADTNIRKHYEIQNAAWVWHPDYLQIKQSSILLFKCKFHLSEDTNLRIHVSADHRYELYLDDQFISKGPHRCDEYHWSFSSYDLELKKGEHTFSAICTWLQNEAPEAQHTIGYGGFIFASEGKYAEILNTGIGNWQTAKWEGWSFEPNPIGKRYYCVVGHQFVMNGQALSKGKNWVSPQILMKPLTESKTGLIRRQWKLYPTSLPELMHEPRTIGKLRGLATEDNCSTEISPQSKEATQWDQLIKQNKSLTIEKNTSQKWIIDLEDYYCGFPQIKLSDGKDSVIKILWAESLYLEKDKIKNKGNRNEISNKIFYGFGDTILQSGESTTYKPLWWRCGRYIMIEIQTKDQALKIDAFSIIESRYPYEYEGKFASSDPGLEAVIPLMVRGLQSCSHESFMDCPYYEQLMYVGDARIEMLVNSVMSKDSRLTKRCIELFDWSRYSTGYVMERYPSYEQQLSLTFSLIWPLILKDYALWRNDRKWVQARLVGARSMLENMRTHCNEKGLLDNLPGWSFIDWVPGWSYGEHADLDKEPSSIINLFFVLALQSTADLEMEYGDELLANRNRIEANRTSQAIKETFWNKEKSLFADNPKMSSYSEHAQSLALIADILDGEENKKCMESLLKDSNLHRATVYFSHYLFEAYAKNGKANLLEEKFKFWKNMLEIGMTTPVEQPEPSRSDCHAWGSHPLYHYYVSIAGIKPASFGFRTVTVSPQPGDLTFINCVLPHPEGEIKLHLNFANNKATGTIELPSDITGQYIYKEKNMSLHGGMNQIQ